eukprot:GHRQ01025098.1.p2 GENE.GHRQ01025098.1~~GHRQ01025098.1.p2  ORF type:complete len:109 (-),score=4.70 GHRQ01025098.1:1124-1450(-)
MCRPLPHRCSLLCVRTRLDMRNIHGSRFCGNGRCLLTVDCGFCWLLLPLLQVSLLETGYFQDNVVTHLFAGLGAGFFAVCVGSPVDVVKSRVMGECQQHWPRQAGWQG